MRDPSTFLNTSAGKLHGCPEAMQEDLLVRVELRAAWLVHQSARPSLAHALFLSMIHSSGHLIGSHCDLLLTFYIARSFFADV